MLAVPSRTNVPQYQLLKKEIDELVGRINGQFATINWTPIWYFYAPCPLKILLISIPPVMLRSLPLPATE